MLITEKNYIANEWDFKFNLSLAEDDPEANRF
jgi:hypothetical protein